MSGFVLQKQTAFDSRNPQSPHFGAKALSVFNVQALPATSAAVVEEIMNLEEALIGREPVEVPTRHLIHGGMYARTIVMPAGMVLTGALLKVATIVFVSGSAAVLAGDEWVELRGENVMPASAGRKQIFVSRTEVTITMVFATSAQTVAEAEAQMTDQAAQLLSRRQDANLVVVTGE